MGHGTDEWLDAHYNSCYGAIDKADRAEKQEVAKLKKEVKKLKKIVKRLSK
jgi:hypothetical protein